MNNEGMILNQLTNHVREIIIGLRTEFIRVPDYICQILDSFARYKTGGAAGHSVSIPALLRRGKAMFYSGLDEAQDTEENTQVERHFAFWKHLYIDVAIIGTVLKQTIGLTVDQFISQTGSLGHMNDTDRLMLLNILKSEYLTAAGGLQGKKVAALHGHYHQLEDDEAQRKPEDLDDLFNEEGDFHGIAPNAQGEWDNDHIWGRRPLGNHGTDAERKLRNRPQIYDFRISTPGGDPDGAPVKPSIENLEPVLRGYMQVVQGGKLGYMWHEGFSALVQDILNKNLTVPRLVMGGAGWEFDIDCVKIAGTTIISDPNAKEEILRVLDVGTPGMEDGTVFPMYYDPMTNPVDWLRTEAEMLSQNKGRPKGMDFGRPRMTPYQGSEWRRSDKHVDAAISRILLDYIPILSPVRGNQLEIRGLKAA